MTNSLLLVDESPLIHRVVELTFEGHDISVYSADDIEEALALARSLKPDIVIASTHIKRSNGLDFCRELQGDANLAEIPILLLASPKENLSEEEAQAAGAIGILTKPFEPESLLSEVGLALSWTTSSTEEDMTSAGELDTPDVPAGIPDEEMDEPGDFSDEPEPSPREEIVEDDIDESKLSIEIDAFPDPPDVQLPDDQEEEAPFPETLEEQELSEKAEDVLDEVDARIDPGVTEEDTPGQAISEPPSMGEDMSIDTPSDPPGEPSSQEEDLFGETDIEDLFDEYSADAESGSSEAASIDAEDYAATASPETDLVFPEIGEGEKQSGGPPAGEPGDPEEADLAIGDEELASLQAELSADLEEIEGTHFQEDKVRAAEEELASLEAELAMEEGLSPDAEISASPPETSDDLELDQGSIDIAGEPADETGSKPPYDSPEIYALSPEEDTQSDAGEPGGTEDDLAALIEETDFGPEPDTPIEILAGEEIPGVDDPLDEESLKPDALLEDELSAPFMDETASEAKGETGPREPEMPQVPGPDEDALNSLVEQNLEKSVEAIVPAILRRIESIIVERLPDMVEKIVLREIEKIKRGE